MGGVRQNYEPRRRYNLREGKVHKNTRECGGGLKKNGGGGGGKNGILAKRHRSFCGGGKKP